MRFTLLDRVTAIDPGKSITAIKTLTLSEEYLADHFPRFPVMPGVLMLESMTQAAAWTIRLGEDFAHAIVVLRSAKNVKYGDFVEPGKVLTVTAEVLSQDETTTKIKATGTVGGRTSLTARLTLERYNLADRVAHGDALDARVRGEMRKLWAVLHPAGRGVGGRSAVALGGRLPDGGDGHPSGRCRAAGGALTSLRVAFPRLRVASRSVGEAWFAPTIRPFFARKQSPPCGAVGPVSGSLNAGIQGRLEPACLRVVGVEFADWAKSPPFPGFHGGSISLKPVVVTPTPHSPFPR